MGGCGSVWRILFAPRSRSESPAPRAAEPDGLQREACWGQREAHGQPRGVHMGMWMLSGAGMIPGWPGSPQLAGIAEGDHHGRLVGTAGRALQQGSSAGGAQPAPRCVPHGVPLLRLPGCAGQLQGAWPHKGNTSTGSAAGTGWDGARCAGAGPCPAGTRWGSSQTLSSAPGGICCGSAARYLHSHTRKLPCAGR